MKWLDTKQVKDTGKTKVWDILSKDGSVLGQVKWYGAWRQYCFYPAPGCIWNIECLSQLTAWIVERNQDHHNFRVVS